MPSSPDLDTAELLDTTVDALTLAGNVIIGPVRPSEKDALPSECVFVMQQGGLLPEGYLDGNVDAPEIRHPIIEVVVRGQPDDYKGGQTLARDVYRALHNVFPRSAYFYARIQHDEPIFIGWSPQQEPMWRMSYRLRIEE